MSRTSTSTPIVAVLNWKCNSLPLIVKDSTNKIPTKESNVKAAKESSTRHFHAILYCSELTKDEDLKFLPRDGQIVHTGFECCLNLVSCIKLFCDKVSRNNTWCIKFHQRTLLAFRLSQQARNYKTPGAIHMLISGTRPVHQLSSQIF